MSKATMTRLFVGSVAAVVAGLLLGFVALLDTAQLDDKVWLIVLLVLGLVGLGFVAVVAYVIAGPDGASGGRTTHRPSTPPVASRP